MVDKISIQKIANGYLVTTNWYQIKEENSSYHPDLTSTFKHLEDCFANKEVKKQV